MVPYADFNLLKFPDPDQVPPLKKKLRTIRGNHGHCVGG